jgi:hypothetical protein
MKFTASMAVSWPIFEQRIIRVTLTPNSCIPYLNKLASLIILMCMSHGRLLYRLEGVGRIDVDLGPQRPCSNSHIVFRIKDELLISTVCCIDVIRGVISLEPSGLQLNNPAQCRLQLTGNEIWDHYRPNDVLITITNSYLRLSVNTTLTVYKRWCFHGRDYEECRLLGYRKSVHTSQETHYISATESSQLILCKFWGFHGSDYEECRLLIYRKLVRTSQETLSSPLQSPAS